MNIYVCVNIYAWDALKFDDFTSHPKDQRGSVTKTVRNKRKPAENCVEGTVCVSLDWDYLHLQSVLTYDQWINGRQGAEQTNSPTFCHIVQGVHERGYRN